MTARRTRAWWPAVAVAVGIATWMVGSRRPRSRARTPAKVGPTRGARADVVEDWRPGPV